MAAPQWKPKTIEERLDRVESMEAIRLLPHRYAEALDSRNMEDLVELFVEDVRVGAGETGREALKKWFIKTMSVPKTSIHFVANHTIVMDDADNAHGIVYCYDQLEKGAEWHYGFLQYWDKYVRRNGEWQFFRRKFHRWYMVDALTRPSHGAGCAPEESALTTHQLPDAFPSWGRFWKEQAVK